jgi:Viral BACON domain/Reeler domain
MIAYPTGAPAGYTGAPASSVDSGSDCTSCHGGTAQTAGLSITGFGSGNTYTPGAVEHLTVTLPASTSRHGFEFTARSASSTGTGEGALASTDSTTQVLSGGLFITHTNGSAANTFNFDWTPPATNVGNIIFYAAGVNGYSNVIKTNLTLTPSGGGGAPPPTLGVSPISLSFAYQIGGATPAAQNLSITSTGAALSFTAAASGGTWLSASPASGTTPGSVSVSVNPAGLAAGTYNGSVAIAASGAGNSPQRVAVTFTVTPAPLPNLTVSPTSLSFSAQAGGAAPAAQSVSVGSSGAALNFTAGASGGAWLAASPGSGTTLGRVSVSVNPAGLAAGTYNGSVAIEASGAGNSPQTVAVTLTVTAAPPPSGGGLTVTPTAVSFSATVSGADPAAQALSVQAASSTRFRASASGASGGVTWLSISPSGRLTTNQNIAVTVAAAGLAAGTYTGSISLRVSRGEDSYITTTVPVTLVVAPLTLSLVR